MRPYIQYTQDLQVTLAIINGRIPRPEPTLDSAEKELIWTICLKYWARTPSHRPTAEEISNDLTGREVVSYYPESNLLDSLISERIELRPEDDDVKRKCTFPSI